MKNEEEQGVIPERLHDQCGEQPVINHDATAALATTADHLRRFYRELQAWIDVGMPAHEVFSPYRRICSTAKRWQRNEGLAREREWLLWDRIGDQFEAAGLPPGTPFMAGDNADDFNGLYANPARLAWIKANAEAEPPSMTNAINHEEAGSFDLFADDFAEVMKKHAGEPYRPSNGIEGDMFQERFCDRCTKDDYDHETGGGILCPIIGDTMCMGVDDPAYPKAWVISERGQPICTEFEPATQQQESSQ